MKKFTAIIPFCALLLAFLSACRNTQNESTDLNAQTLQQQRTKFNRTPLINAVLTLDTARVKDILENGADPNIADSKTLTPLHYAASVYSPEVMTLLLNAKANVDARTSDGRTPLMEAARLGNSEAVKQLTASGADMNAVDDKDRTPVMFAASARVNSLEIVKFMFEKGASENVIDSSAKGIAAHAVDGGNSETALFLADRMPDLATASQASAEAYVTMKQAIAKNDVQVVKRLIEKNLPLDSDISTVFKAMEIANMEGVYEFFARNSLIRDGKKPIFWAAEYDRIDIIKILLDAGADPNAEDSAGNKAIDYANKYETVRALRDAMKKKKH